MEEDLIENKLTESQVADVIINVQQLSKYLYDDYKNKNYSPQNQNYALIGLNNNISIPTKDKLNKALANYPKQEDVLQEYSQFMSMYDMIYKRFIEYYSSMLSFDIDYVVDDTKRSVDFNSSSYKDDLKRIEKFISKFDFKYYFIEKALKNMVTRGVFYGWFRQSIGTINNTPLDIEDDNEENVKIKSKSKKLSRYMLQMMPQNQCKLDGEFEYGLTYSLNMSYFLKSGVSLDSYDPVMKKMFRTTFGNEKNPKYNPNAKYDNRTGTYAQWSQTEPDEGAFVFKFDTSTFSSIPFLAPLIRNCLTDLEMERLQTNKNIISAYGILAGSIELLSKTTSGQTSDQTAYSPTNLVKLMKLASNGLQESIKSVALPINDIKFHQYQDYDNKMADTQLKMTSAQGASAGRLLYSNEKLSESELKASIQNDFNMMKKLYSQFESFMNFYANKKTKKHKFIFTFSGGNYPFLNEARNTNLMSLMDKGVVLAPRFYAKLVDMQPQHFVTALREGKDIDWTNKLTSSLISIHTTNDTETPVGKPKAKENKISDNGSTARDYE